MPGKIKICKETDCRNAATTKGHCRLHYLRHWKEIKEDEKKKAAKRLNSYVDRICQKHPKRYVKVIKEDLADGAENEKDIDDNYAATDVENILEDLGYNDDTQINRIIQRIKIDDSF